MNRKIIFVGGVHGVGKTTLCKELANKLDVKSFSSSDLIKRIDQSKVNADKHIENMNINEDILIRAINKYVDNDAASILDGHFCLIDNEHKLEYIPLSVFKDINPVAIIVLIDEPTNIQRRLENRDCRTVDINFIQKSEDYEVSYARKIADKLEKSILICDKKTGINEILAYIRGAINL